VVLYALGLEVNRSRVVVSDFHVGDWQIEVVGSEIVMGSCRFDLVQKSI